MGIASCNSTTLAECCYSQTGSSDPFCRSYSLKCFRLVPVRQSYRCQFIIGRPSYCLTSPFYILLWIFWRKELMLHLALWVISVVRMSVPNQWQWKRCYIHVSLWERVVKQCVLVNEWVPGSKKSNTSGGHLLGVLQSTLSLGCPSYSHSSECGILAFSYWWLMESSMPCGRGMPY